MCEYFEEKSYFITCVLQFLWNSVLIDMVIIMLFDTELPYAYMKFTAYYIQHFGMVEFQNSVLTLTVWYVNFL
jgi:hypothetical protein